MPGIHGAPALTWADVNPTPGNEHSGYCTHVSILFPTWHRPYLALYEVQSQFQTPKATILTFDCASKSCTMSYSSSLLYILQTRGNVFKGLPQRFEFHTGIGLPHPQMELVSSLSALAVHRLLTWPGQVGIKVFPIHCLATSSSHSTDQYSLTFR